jgi:hypothetical protein
MLVTGEGEIDDTGDSRQDDGADHGEAARPRAGLPVIALADDVIHRRLQEHAVLMGTTIRRSVGIAIGTSFPR